MKPVLPQCVMLSWVHPTLVSLLTIIIGNINIYLHSFESYIYNLTLLAVPGSVLLPEITFNLYKSLQGPASVPMFTVVGFKPLASGMSNSFNWRRYPTGWRNVHAWNTAWMGTRVLPSSTNGSGRVAICDQLFLWPWAQNTVYRSNSYFVIEI